MYIFCTYVFVTFDMIFCCIYKYIRTMLHARRLARNYYTTAREREGDPNDRPARPTWRFGAAEGSRQSSVAAAADWREARKSGRTDGIGSGQYDAFYRRRRLDVVVLCSAVRLGRILYNSKGKSKAHTIPYVRDEHMHSRKHL